MVETNLIQAPARPPLRRTRIVLTWLFLLALGLNLLLAIQVDWIFAPELRRFEAEPFWRSVVAIDLIGFYFLPIFVASIRRHYRTHAIALLDIAVGWTGVGWIAALAWALSRPEPKI